MFLSPLKITKEREDELKTEFLNFFSDPSESWGMVHFKRLDLSDPNIPNFGT
jgi:hypothetical protein